MTTRRFAIILTILLFTITLTGCFFLPEEDEYLPPPLREPGRIEYTTVEVTRGDISDEVRGQGVVEARSGVVVSFGNISGLLKALHFRSGHDVEEGDLMAELQNDELLEKLRRQEIYTRLAEIDFERSRRGTRLDREAAQLRLDLSKLDLELAREEAERTLLYAPVSGRIVYATRTMINEQINPYQDIFTIVDMSDLVLRVSGEFASRTPLGTEVKIMINSEIHFGTIIQVPALSPVDSEDRDIAVIECDTLDPADFNLGTGFLIINELASAEDAVIVQTSFIRHDGGRTYVILLENGVPVERNVVIGLSTTTLTEIISGLSEGDLLVQ